MKTLFLLATLTVSQLGFASGSHYHPKQILKCAGECTETQVRGIVPQALDTLVKAGEVKEAWKTVAIEKIEKKQFSKAQEWVVSFFDKNQKEASKQRLFMFVSLDGWLNGANNTGN